MSTLKSIQQALDEVAKPHFSCHPVSWEDVQRTVYTNGSVSSGGPNISDVRLCSKEGKRLYTLRSNNWEDRLGKVELSDVAVVVGNHLERTTELKCETLETVLRKIPEYAAYAGMDRSTPSLATSGKDAFATVRFQTVFLPVEGELGAFEFCTEVYNYQTRDNKHPRNLTLLCLPQGMSVQQDTVGYNKLFYHAVDSDKKVHRYWLEAERSKHAVGTQQVETDAEKQEAAARGKATAMFIGPKEIGTRFNIQMMVQVPLVMPTYRGRGVESSSYTYGSCGVTQECASSATGVSYEDECDFCSSSAANAPKQNFFESKKSTKSRSSSSSSSSAMDVERKIKPKTGISNAARVSRGSEYDTWTGLVQKQPVRNPDQHVTITVTCVYTCADGVPTPADVKAAIDDLNALYKSCKAESTLGDANVKFGSTTVTKTYTPPAFVPNNVNSPFDQV